MICIGKYHANLKNAFQKDVKEIYEVKDMEEAVDTASFLAQKDDIVLFSPACKSDKAEETFVERGDEFTNIVKQLENECHQ